VDVWECDLVNIYALGKFNDNYKYIISIIDIFSKFLHLVPLRSKTVTAVESAFMTIFENSRRRRRPVLVRTEKGKEFLNKHFQVMLKREGIKFQVCRYPNVKCSQSNAQIGRFAIGFINISPTKIPTGISTFFQNLSGPTMTRFTWRRAWRRRE